MTNTLSESIGAIADSLGISAEGVYSALIQQVRAEAVFYAALCALCAAAIWARKKAEDECYNEEWPGWVITGCVSVIIIATILLGYSIYKAVTYSMSPESEAIKKALELFGKQ